MTAAGVFPFLLGGIFGFGGDVPASLVAGNAYLRLRCSSVKRWRKSTIKSVVLKQAGGGGLVLLTRLLSAGIVVVILMSPVWLQSSMVCPLVIQANSVATIMLCVGCLLAGLIVDRVRSAKPLCVGSILLACSSWFFYHLAGTHLNNYSCSMGWLGFALRRSRRVPYVMVRAFPAEVRFTGFPSPTTSLTLSSAA